MGGPPRSDSARRSCGASPLFSWQNVILPDARERTIASRHAAPRAAASEWPDTAGVGKFSGSARSWQWSHCRNFTSLEESYDEIDSALHHHRGKVAVSLKPDHSPQRGLGAE